VLYPFYFSHRGVLVYFGFGPVGHETVAYIAEDRLTPATLKKVNDILGNDDDLASVSNWADAIRNFQEETKPWHFIDLPIRQQVTVAKVMDFCPNNDCVIAQIQINKGVLTNPASNLGSLRPHSKPGL
jgi:hypothetical protein